MDEPEGSPGEAGSETVQAALEEALRCEAALLHELVAWLARDEAARASPGGQAGSS